MPSPLPVPILLASHSVGHGGGERQLALAALHLDRRRFSPHVLSVQGGFWLPRLLAAGVPHYPVPLTSFLNVGALRQALRLRRWMQLHNIKIVQVFDYTMNLFAIPIARSLPGVVALSAQRCLLDLVPPRYRRATTLVHQHAASAVVVNSHAAAAELVQRAHLNPNRILYLPNAIDTAHFSPGGPHLNHLREGADLTIGAVCILRPEKLLHSLLDAFAALIRRHPSARLRLLIIGSGPEADPLRTHASQLGLDDSRCFFQPSLDDVAPALRAIDIFVLPSQSEGLSNSLMEALSCRCACVATDVGGNPELIQHQHSGLLYPPGDVPALTNCLDTLLLSPELRQSLAARGHASLQQSFSIQACIHRLESLYQELLPCAS